MTYRELLEQHFNVSRRWRDLDDNECYRIVGLNKGLWTEDEVKIVRRTYEPITEQDGSVCIVRDGIKVLVKVPSDVESYSIREGVMEVDEQAFGECTKLRSLTVPYTVCEYDLEAALSHAPNKDRMVVTLHDWPHDCRISDELVRDIDEGFVDEQGFVYSKDRKRLLRAVAQVDEYFIPEGVEKIEQLAFNGCRFETLHVPYTCRLDELEEEEYPIFGSERVAGDVVQWSVPYDRQDECPDWRCISNHEEVMERDGVRFSHNGKRLLNAMVGFDADVFEVPDGVETICDMAFSMCLKPLTLVIPPSVKVIGRDLFGSEGGRVVLKDFALITCSFAK